MAICRSVLRSQAAQNPPRRCFAKGEPSTYPDIKEDMFIAWHYLISRSRAQRRHARARWTRGAASLQARFANGHALKPPGMVVGIDSGTSLIEYGRFSRPLERDDCLVLYTDGVTEALDTDGNEFGANGTVQSSGQRRQRRPGHCRAADRRSTQLRWIAPQNDDITLIAIRKNMTKISKDNLTREERIDVSPELAGAARRT